MKMLDRAAILGLIALLTWILMRGFSLEDAPMRDALQALDEYEASESALHRDVLSARAGILNNYDPLVLHVERMRTASNRAAASLKGMQQQNEGEALGQAMQRQETLTERFKSRNALLQNSLAYFGLFSARISTDAASASLRRDVDRLSAGMLGLSLHSDDSAVQDVRTRLAALQARCRPRLCSDNVQGLLTHGGLLVRVLPETATIIEELVRAGGAPTGRRLQARLLVAQRAAEDIAGRYRLLLYLGSVLLVYLLVRLILQVRAHSELMRRQDALEHAIADASTRLTMAPPDRLKRVVHESLGELATLLGASCAWFRFAGDGTSCVWPQGSGSPPASWAAVLVERATPQGAERYGIVQLSRRSCRNDPAAVAALEAAGVESCYCIVPPGEGTSRNVLAFGLSRGHEQWAVRKLAVLSAALDAISLALERARLEKERMRLEAQLGQTRRMETIGAFASGIAHNFNNLLGAISGHVEMAAAAVDRGSALCNHVEQIRVSADRGRQLVDAILTFGRRYDHDRAATDLFGLVSESVALAQAALGPEYKVALSPKSQPLTVAADGAQLQQVVLNLCHNAAQAMPGGGAIRVALTRHESPETLYIGERRLQSGSFAAIDVTDTGCGIPPSLLRKVFDPFFTTRASGTGLGLSTARDIVAEHDGGLLLDSVLGQGTTVRILLPLLAKDAQPAVGRGSVHGAGEVVQFVAANRQLLASGEDLLAALGYEPVGFVDLDAAMAALRAHAARFDVLLVGGLSLDREARALLACARAAAPAMPRLFSVRHADDYLAATLAEAGVTAVLPFPLDPRELALALKDALAVPRHLVRPPIQMA